LTAPADIQARFINTSLGNLDSMFENARSYYQAISDNFAQQVDNANATVQWSGLFITCYDVTALRYSLTVGGSVFGQITWYSAFNCNPLAQWTINIGGEGDVTFQGGNFPGILESTLFNVLGSGRNIQSTTGVVGNILAPSNTLTQSGGNIGGLVIVGNIANALSIMLPDCSDFHNFDVYAVLDQGANAGDTRIYVASLSGYADGDVITINGQETVTIVDRGILNGQAYIDVTPALQNNYPSGTFIKSSVNPYGSRDVSGVNIQNTNGNVPSEAVHQGISVLMMIFVASLAIFVV